MQQADGPTGFKIWAVDNVVYGPVELPTLVDWVKDERVTSETWVYRVDQDSWQKASEVPELQMFFRSPQDKAPAATGSATARAAGNLKPGTLRRIKIFGDLTDRQLESLAGFLGLQPVRQWTEIVKQGGPADAMFLVLDGEVRVRLMIERKETTLATLGPGEIFGELSAFDDGPRSADIVANKDSQLLRIRNEDFHRLASEHPDLATPILLAIGKALAARIRADNKRFGDSIRFARAAGS
jgi:hypothetical protein